MPGMDLSIATVKRVDLPAFVHLATGAGKRKRARKNRSRHKKGGGDASSQDGTEGGGTEDGEEGCEKEEDGEEEAGTEVGADGSEAQGLSASPSPALGITFGTVSPGAWSPEAAGEAAGKSGVGLESPAKRGRRAAAGEGLEGASGDDATLESPAKRGRGPRPKAKS